MFFQKNSLDTKRQNGVGDKVIAKGQKKLQKEAESRSQQQQKVATDAQTRLVTGSAERKDQEARVKARRATIDSGDYSNAKDFASNKSRVAASKTARDNVRSLIPTGAGGLGLQYADPTQIALSEKIATDEFGRDQAAQAESDIRDYNNQTEAMEEGVINRQIGIDEGVMGTAFSQSNTNHQQAAQIAAQRSQAFMQAVGMALGGVTSIMGMGAAGGGGAMPQAGYNLQPDNFALRPANMTPGRGYSAGGITPLR